MRIGVGLSEPGKCARFISQLLSWFEVLMFYFYLSQYGSSLLKYQEKKKASQQIQKRKKDGQVGAAVGAVSKPARALKDEIHFVSSSAPSLPDEGSRGEEREREGWREREGEIERESV